MADRFITDTDAGNTGDGAITIDVDPAAAAFAPAPPYRLAVNAAGEAEISDIATGTLLLTAPITATPIVAAGFGITITGNPKPGHSFRILARCVGSSDNGNARALARLRDTNGPGGTIKARLDASIASIARVASGLAETGRLSASALAVKDDTARAADAISGVDLDREAAELTRLQAAYRANAQVIAAARDLFDAIIGIIR